MKREGRDVSIITWSREVNFSMEAAAALAQEGIEAEVLDLRTLVPLDWDAIVRTVSKTHNVIIVSEEVKRGSFAGELSAQIGEELFDELDAPVERVCGLNICSPFSPVLEDKNFPPSGGHRGRGQARAEQVRRENYGLRSIDAPAGPDHGGGHRLSVGQA